jgi:hypothetical protein
VLVTSLTKQRVKYMKEKLDDKAAMEWYDQHNTEHWKHWRAWGSWFSWGSPVGLGLFYALVVISTGVTIWLIHHK